MSEGIKIETRKPKTWDFLLYVFLQRKTAGWGTGCFKEKVFRFLWGVAKNYILYWGVTSIIIA